MPLKLSDLRAAITSKQTLSTDLSAAQATIATLTQERDTARGEATTERTRADGLQSELDGAQTEINQLTETVTGLQQSATTVSVAAREQLNQLGVPAAELPATVDATAIVDDAAIYSTWLNAKGTEKQKIFSQNKAVIIAQAKRRA